MNWTNKIIKRTIESPKTDKLMSEAKSNRITPSCSQQTSVIYAPIVIKNLKSNNRLLVGITRTILTYSNGARTFIYAPKCPEIEWSPSFGGYNTHFSIMFKHNYAWSLYKTKVHHFINLILFFSIHSKTTRGRTQICWCLRSIFSRPTQTAPGPFIGNTDG